MTDWRATVKVKHLLLMRSSEYDDIQASMAAIAAELERSGMFTSFRWLGRFSNIPRGDDILSAEDYANRLLDWMYDYANEQRIWID